MQIESTRKIYKERKCRAYRQTHYYGSKIFGFTQKVVAPTTEMRKEGERELLTDDELSFREVGLAVRYVSGDFSGHWEYVLELESKIQVDNVNLGAINVELIAEARKGKSIPQ